MHLPNGNVEIKNLIAQTHSLASLFGYDDDEKAGVVKQKGIRGFFTNECRTTISIHASISLLPSIINYYNILSLPNENQLRVMENANNTRIIIAFVQLM